VPLEPLSVRGVALTVATMLHRRPPPPEIARRIHVASGGQPAYVEEVVRQLVQARALEQRGLDGNRVDWAQRDTLIPLAPSARQGVDKALRRLPMVQRRLLEALMIAGDEAAPESLARGLALSVAEIEPSVAQLVEHGWLRWDEGTPRRLLWSRPHAHRVLDEQLHPCRRHLFTRSMADGLLAEPLSAGRLKLLLALGNVQEAAENIGACVQQLIFAGRTSEGLELLDEIVRRIADVKLPPEQIGDIYVLHARCLLMVRPTDPIIGKSLARAQQLVTKEETRAETSLLRARLQAVIGHYPNFRKQLLEAWQAMGRADHRVLAPVIAGHLGHSFLWSGQPRTASEWFDEAKASAQDSGDPIVIAHAEAAYAVYLYTRGDLLEAERLSAETLRTFEPAANRRGYWGAVATWADTLRCQGRFSEALALVTLRLPEAREGESPSHYIRLLLTCARCEVDLCRLGRAQECMDELDSVIRAGEYLHQRLEARLLRGRILLTSGQYRDAAEVLQDVHQRARTAELVSVAEHARTLQSETLWALGEQDLAREGFRNACLGIMGSGDVVTLAEACASRARVLCEEEEPSVVFRPVQVYLQTQPVALLRLEQQLAQARWLEARQDLDGAQTAWREAAAAMNRVALGLNETDRAALRVHPWSRRIRRGLT
jgi:tetratricopeptide (TPR) repeat protein